MSCKECEKKQDLAFDKNIPQSVPIAYIRVGVANIAIIGCEEHVKATIEKIRKGEE